MHTGQTRHLKVVIISLENIFTGTSASSFLTETRQCRSSFLTICPEDAVKHEPSRDRDVVVRRQTAKNSGHSAVYPTLTNANKEDDALEKMPVSVSDPKS